MLLGKAVATWNVFAQIRALGCFNTKRDILVLYLWSLKYIF